MTEAVIERPTARPAMDASLLQRAGCDPGTGSSFRSLFHSNHGG
jgi:hypothetical protein